MGHGTVGPTRATARTANSASVSPTIPSRPPAPATETDRWKVWDSFLEATPGTGFMQTSWWTDFRATCGYEHFGITLKASNAIVGGAVVQKFSYDDHRCFYYIQDGPVLPQDDEIAGEVFEAIFKAIEDRRLAEQQTVSHLRIEPRWLRLPGFVSGFRTIPPLTTDRFLEVRDTRCIALRPSEAAILAQMKPKGRYNIGVARRHNVSIVEDASGQGLRDFLGIYEETMTRQGQKPKPPNYFRNLVLFSSPADRRSLFFAEYQGMRIATALVMYFGPKATYFFGGSRDIHRQVMAPYLLHFEVMRKAKALGHEWYDLWGIAPANEPDHPWQNLSVFKAKFGGEELHLVPTLDYVYDKAAYDCYGRAAMFD